MKNNNDEIQKLASSSPRVKRLIPWAGIGVLFSTFSVIVLIAVFSFSFYKVSMIGKQFQDNLLALQKRVDAMQINTENIEKQSQQLGEVVKQAVNDVRQSQSDDKNTWRVMEAQYYVRLADTELQIENNISVAIQLLETADKEIQKINDPRYDVIRKALAEDIVKLQHVPQVDYTGIYMRLLAIDGQVDKLPMMVRQSESNAAAMPADKSLPWWRRGLSESWAALQKIIVVRYHASGVPPLIAPGQEEFLLQNLHATLERAMWAVLNKKQDVYQTSVQKASDWVSTYFIVNLPATQGILTTLSQLKQMDIHPAIPEITASLQAFHHDD